MTWRRCVACYESGAMNGENTERNGVTSGLRGRSERRERRERRRGGEHGR